MALTIFQVCIPTNLKLNFGCTLVIVTMDDVIPVANRHLLRKSTRILMYLSLEDTMVKLS